MKQEDTIAEKTESKPKTPFPWKKVFLTPFKVLWSVLFFLVKAVWWIIKFILKTIWWFTKLFLFFAFIFMGLIAVVAPMCQVIGNPDSTTLANQDKYAWVDGKRVLVKKRASSRLFGVAGKLWRSLWGGSKAEE